MWQWVPCRCQHVHCRWSNQPSTELSQPSALCFFFAQEEMTSDGLPQWSCPWKPPHPCWWIPPGSVSSKPPTVSSEALSPDGHQPLPVMLPPLLSPFVTSAASSPQGPWPLECKEALCKQRVLQRISAGPAFERFSVGRRCFLPLKASRCFVCPQSRLKTNFASTASRGSRLPAMHSTFLTTQGLAVVCCVHPCCNQASTRPLI